MTVVASTVALRKRGSVSAPDARSTGESEAAAHGASLASSSILTDETTPVSEAGAAPPAKKARLSRDVRLARLTGAVRTILECIEETPSRPGLLKTPQRYAKALLELTSGYSLTPQAVIGDATFEESHSELVLVRDISLFSLCEHHMLPFHGTAHIAYIPNGAVLGLSKLARVVQVYARRLQVQERLTNEIADAISECANARGVMVYIASKHLCMSMRGVEKPDAVTITTAVRGRYAEEAELRQQFLATIAIKNN